MPHLARSGFILRSPRRVSRKREFSWIWLETFGNSRPERSERQSPETIGDEKNPRVAGPSATKEGNSLKRGMPGWGESADRTRLLAISLLTGNFTGNFAIFGRQETVS
jgi:hypothetical protein